ncbi:MAG: quinone oxidoreductase family protein [Roseiarcus sp.]
MTLAITLAATGGPEVLQPCEIEVAAPGRGEALVRQTHVGVNYVDVYFRSGLYPLPSLPATLGLEGAGVVASVGPETDDVKVGDRVAYVGFPLGAYAQERVLPASRLVRVPDAIDLRTACGAMARGLTAHLLLHKIAALQAGDWVLVHAAAGGVGQLVARWARRLGLRVVGTVGSPAKADLARAAGAEAVFLHHDPIWVEAVRRVADGRGVRLAIDGIGGAMLAQTLGAVRPLGVVASIGQPAGPIPPVAVEALSYPRSIALARPSVLAYANDPVLYRDGARELFAALTDGLAVQIGAEYDLREAARAHADLEAGRTTGSVLLTVG